MFFKKIVVFWFKIINISVSGLGKVFPERGEMEFLAV